MNKEVNSALIDELRDCVKSLEAENKKVFPDFTQEILRGQRLLKILKLYSSKTISKDCKNL